MHGRLLLDSAPLVAAMVHPLRDVRPFQCRILHLGPPATPALDLPARLLVQFAGLRAQPFRADPPRRRQQMGVVVAMVALATWCVDRHVHRHPMPLADLPCEAQRKLAPRLGRQLGGQRDFIFAGDGRVLARLCLLGGVPEHGPVTGPRRGVGGHDNGVMFDALLAGVFMDEAGALVRDFDTRKIGFRCRTAATAGPAYRLPRQMETGVAMWGGRWGLWEWWPARVRARARHVPGPTPVRRRARQTRYVRRPAGGCNHGRGGCARPGLGHPNDSLPLTSRWDRRNGLAASPQDGNSPSPRPC